MKGRLVKRYFPCNTIMSNINMLWGPCFTGQCTHHASCMYTFPQLARCLPLTQSCPTCYGAWPTLHRSMHTSCIMHHACTPSPNWQDASLYHNHVQHAMGPGLCFTDLCTHHASCIYTFPQLARCISTLTDWIAFLNSLSLPKDFSKNIVY